MHARVALAVALMAFSIDAQERCRESDTPRECFERWVPLPDIAPELVPVKSIAVTAPPAPEKLAALADGIGDFSAPVRAATKDFLSILSGSLDTATIGDDGTALTFGYSPPIPLLIPRGQVRFEAKLVEPQLSEATRLEASADELPALERSLSTLDDVTYYATFNRTSPRLGRAYEPHRALFAALTMLSTDVGDAENAFTRALAAASIARENGDTPFRELAADAVAFETAARAAMPAPPAELADDFAQLILNQSQLYATGTYHVRRNIVGPSTWSGMLTWELSSRNMAGFYRGDGKGCGGRTLQPDEARRCAAAFAAYRARIGKPKRVPRLALSIEYGDTTEKKKDAQGNFARTKSIIYGATFGHPFASALIGREGYFELAATYDGYALSSTATRDPTLLDEQRVPDVEVDAALPPSRRRLAVGATYTQRITDRVAIPVTVVYTDSQFALPGERPDGSPPVPVAPVIVNETRMAVHIGLQYRLVPGTPRPRCACCC